MRAGDCAVRGGRACARGSGAAMTPAALAARIAHLRDAAACRPIGPPRAALAIAAACARWRERGFPARRNALARIAEESGWSSQLLDESIDALLAPFTYDALAAFASQLTPRPRAAAFIMPANVPGAGMHELAAAVISGAAAMVKVSPREPHFLPAFAGTLRQ